MELKLSEWVADMFDVMFLFAYAVALFGRSSFKIPSCRPVDLTWQDGVMMQVIEYVTRRRGVKGKPLQAVRKVMNGQLFIQLCHWALTSRASISKVL